MLFCTRFTIRHVHVVWKKTWQTGQELTSGEVGKGVGFGGGVKRDLYFFTLSSVSQLCFPHLFPKESF